MALYPPAVKKLIPPGSNDPRITAVGAVLHVDAGNSSSLYTYFSTKSGGIESHFHIRLDGVVEQYRDTAYEADANYKGNSFSLGGKLCGFVSIETQGYGSGSWTSAQLASIKKLLAWLAATHKFPLRVCPAWNAPGVGYHVMFGAPGPWTPVAKSCPGPNRIKQFDSIIVPWMKAGGSTGGDMAITLDDLKKIFKTDGILRVPSGYEESTNKFWTFESFVRSIQAWSRKGSLLDREIAAGVKQLLANQEAMKVAQAELAKALAAGLNLDPAEFAAAIETASEAGAAAALQKMIDDARVELVVEDEG